MRFILGSPEAVPLRLLAQLPTKAFNFKNSRAATMQNDPEF